MQQITEEQEGKDGGEICDKFKQVDVHDCDEPNKSDIGGSSQINREREQFRQSSGNGFQLS